MNEKSENRKALPKFTLSLLGSLLVGGVIGFAIGLSRAMGLDTAALAEGLPPPPPGEAGLDGPHGDV